MSQQGGCACGQVRYTMAEPPDYASYCHCTMCRHISGAPFTGWVQVPDGQVNWEGTPQDHVSSAGIKRKFCSGCGTNLTFEADEAVFVTLGSLDDPLGIRVHCHTYVATALPGILPDDGLPRFDGPAGGKGGKPD